MADIRKYIVLSKSSQSIVNIFSDSNKFKEYYDKAYNNEKNSIIKHFIVNNIPFAFRDRPILYEQLIQYFADKLLITSTEIKLIGSAKTGFSISPLPNYGKEFGQHSDLDFSIINSELFIGLEKEFRHWKSLFKQKEISPNPGPEGKYWIQNLDTGERQVKRGFIDSHYVPNRDLFMKTKVINNSLWFIKNYLHKEHDIIVKRATVRIYRSWMTFEETLRFNTNSVMNAV
jgi:hypothetical protein